MDFRYFTNVQYSTVELESGKIEIDGHDIATMGLDVLRERLALVPQDTSLFLGTLRQNLCDVSYSLNPD